MGLFDSRGAPTRRSLTAPRVDDVPTSCPTCESSAIMTTAKSPDANSYWRCESCGELWNKSRRDRAPRRRY